MDPTVMPTGGGHEEFICLRSAGGHGRADRAGETGPGSTLPWSVRPALLRVLLVLQDTPDVLTGQHVGVAQIDVLELVGLGDHAVEVQLALVVEA